MRDCYLKSRSPSVALIKIQNVSLNWRILSPRNFPQVSYSYIVFGVLNGKTVQLLRNPSSQPRSDIVHISNNTVLSAHSLETGRLLDFENANIRYFEDNERKRKINEIVEIQKDGEAVNFQTDVVGHFNVYSLVIEKYITHCLKPYFVPSCFFMFSLFSCISCFVLSMFSIFWPRWWHRRLPKRRLRVILCSIAFYDGNAFLNYFYQVAIFPYRNQRDHWLKYIYLRAEWEEWFWYCSSDLKPDCHRRLCKNPHQLYTCDNVDYKLYL